MAPEEIQSLEEPASPGFKLQHALEKGNSHGSDTSADPDIVDWDGPDDTECPLNWPESTKWLHIAVISCMTVVTPLGSSMFAPGIPQIMSEFGETSNTIATFVVSIYILGFAFGPLLAAPLNEIFGRAPLYQWGNVVFTFTSIATALSQNMNMMLAFRFLMGLAGAVPVTIGSGTVADLMPVQKRGRAMSAWALGPLLGPCVGPVAGGYLIQGAGWRWVFWLVAIMAGVTIPISFWLLKETSHAIILDRKAENLRRETKNLKLRSRLASGKTFLETLKLASTRPLRMLLFNPIIASMALYVAIVYGILYLLIATFSFVYKDQYGFDEGDVGLTFLPAGIGMMIGVMAFGALADYMIKRQEKKNLPIVPEVRISPRLVLPCAIVLPAGLFIYGWCTHYRVHWAVPMIGVALFSCGLMGVMICMQNYLLDAYPAHAPSVTAALAILRSLAGALLPLGGLEMYDALGLGWGNSLLAFIALAMIPIPLLYYVWGARLRQKSSTQH